MFKKVNSVEYLWTEGVPRRGRDQHHPQVLQVASLILMLLQVRAIVMLLQVRLIEAGCCLLAADIL